MDQVALGKRIKAARERAGMTQEDLAAAVDYSVDHVSVVERGVKAPKLDKLVTIANVLKVGRTSCFRIIWMRQHCFTPQSSPSD